MQRHRTLQALGSALVLAAALVASAPTDARTIRVDVGPFGYPVSGQLWQAPETALAALPVLAGTLPFAINFGSGAVTGFCLYENGFIGFASNCASVPADTISPLAADWISDPAATRIFELGSVTFSEGRLARGAIPPDPLDAPLAVRFHWNEVECASCPGGGTFSFQAILIDMGNGDFDLELNYLGIVPAGVGIGGFLLGANVRQSAGPFLDSVDYDFQFRGGRLVNGTVPEPNPLWLLGLGAVALAATQRRRSVAAS